MGRQSGTHSDIGFSVNSVPKSKKGDATERRRVQALVGVLTNEFLSSAENCGSAAAAHERWKAAEGNLFVGSSMKPPWNQKVTEWSNGVCKSSFRRYVTGCLQRYQYRHRSLFVGLSLLVDSPPACRKLLDTECDTHTHTVESSDLITCSMTRGLTKLYICLIL